MTAIINNTIEIPIKDYRYDSYFDSKTNTRNSNLILDIDSNNYSSYEQYLGTQITSCEIQENNTTITVPAPDKFTRFQLYINSANSILSVQASLIG